MGKTFSSSSAAASVCSFNKDLLLGGESTFKACKTVSLSIGKQVEEGGLGL